MTEEEEFIPLIRDDVTEARRLEHWSQPHLDYVERCLECWRTAQFKKLGSKMGADLD